VIERIEDLAERSVARACGFAGIGILTFVVGLSGDMSLAFKAAGILTLLTCCVLLLKAGFAPQKPYKQTEVWLMLPRDERPSEQVAQKLIGTVLREVYLRFALHAAIIAVVMLAFAFLYPLVLPAPGPR
jgi:hypothetical protein